jgi:hypothetical protein
VLFGAAAEAMAAIPARRKDVVGETAVAADFFDRETRLFGGFFQIRGIPVPRGQVFWTGAAIDPADPDQFPYFLLVILSHFKSLLVNRIAPFVRGNALSKAFRRALLSLEKGGRERFPGVPFQKAKIHTENLSQDQFSIILKGILILGPAGG